MSLASLTDEEASFCKEMRALKAAAPRNLVHPGLLFNLSLRGPKLDDTVQAPHSPRPPPLDTRSNLLEKEVSYRITEGLPAGESFHSQVWLAKPVGFESDSNPCLVFKFIVASLPKEYYRTFQQAVDSQLEPFEQLWFLHGSFLPWIYGLHDVLCSMSYSCSFPIAPGNDALERTWQAIRHGSIREPECLQVRKHKFKNAYRNLNIAHKAHITHGDTRLDNLLYDDTLHTPSLRLVFIDWRNDSKVDLRGEVMTFFHIDRDICLLYDIFLEAQPEDDDSDDAYCDFIKKTYKDAEMGERLKHLNVKGQLSDDFLTS
ncbi:hypothetical protein VNI00_010570 [Paramarasmius palmivorus]|uniref:CHK kinase-like domain-containing protein n=1 Tax=Paramarasmius palmivorus TaxID=297713 RepID=A0AAW0CJ23_9AGAR